jgi:hypothetical protein
MDIQLRYGNKSHLTETEIDDVIILSKQYGQVNTETWGSRSGAIDLVTFLEVTFSSAFIRTVTKPIVDGYFKGLLNENYFKGLGEQHKGIVQNEFAGFKNYLIAFYKVFISKKQTDNYAISLIEDIDDCRLYIVLNSYRTTEALIENLAEAIVKTYALVTLKILDIQEPKIIQLYPDFENQTWEYLFLPTSSAFGNCIDRYYSFSQDKIFNIDSVEQFISIFGINDFDEYKLLVNPRQH